MSEYEVYTGKEGVMIMLPDSNSPYIPKVVFIDKKKLVAFVKDEEHGLLPKKIEWKDGMIMHKALTKIFGTNLKGNKK